MKDVTDKCRIISIQLIDRSIKNDDGSTDLYVKKFLDVFVNDSARELITEMVIIGDEKCFFIRENRNGSFMFEVLGMNYD